jgi:hypothetical protein
MKTSIDPKVAQCYVSLANQDLTILEDPANKEILEKNKFKVFYVNRGKVQSCYLPSADKKSCDSAIGSLYDIPIYLNLIPVDIAMEKLIGNFSFVENNKFDSVFLTVFKINKVPYVKYSTCFENNTSDAFPICTRLNRYIDLNMLKNISDLPKLFSENKEILTSVQIVLEIKYSLDSLWSSAKRDSIREWELCNWVVELTLTLRRKYKIDMTNYLEPKYFGYPQAESIKINKEFTSLIINLKSDASNIPYLDFLQEQGILNA